MFVTVIFDNICFVVTRFCEFVVATFVSIFFERSSLVLVSIFFIFLN